MDFGVELWTRQAIEIKLGSFLELWLSLDDEPIKRSLGRNEFHLDLTVSADRRVAATGRVWLCQADTERLGLGPIEAPSTRPVHVELAPDSALLGHIRTNVWLDEHSLTQSLRLVVVTRNDTGECLFDDDRLNLSCLAPGRFLFECTRLLTN